MDVLGLQYLTPTWGSKYEGIIWAEGSKDKTKETVCTVSVLGQVMENGIEIHQFDKEKKEGIEETLAKLSLSDSERSRIKQDIEAGHLITIPDEDVTIGSWTGTGYISLDKATGAGAYMISGSLNGGAKPAIATGMAIYALIMEFGSAYFLINALSLVLVPNIIKLAGVAFIMQGIYVINMMLIAYIDYMATHDEAYFDQFVNWFFKSGLISSIQLECAYLLLNLFWVAEACDDEKEETNAEVETDPENTPETNPETTPETNSGAGQVGGGEGKSIINVSNKSIKHILNNHNPNRVAKQLPYNGYIIREYSTYFNKDWSDAQIVEAVEYGYNEALSQGMRTGQYTFIYNGETVTVCLKDGLLQTAYGNYNYTLSDLLGILKGK